MRTLSSQESNTFLQQARARMIIDPGRGAFFSPQFLRNCAFQAALFGGDFRDTEKVVSQICALYEIHSLLCASFDELTPTESFAITGSHDDLARVRTEYHTPSYVISDQFKKIVIVSDSDYYWGVAGAKVLVNRIRDSYANTLLIKNSDIETFVRSDESYNRKAGRMLRDYLDICEMFPASHAQ